MNVESKTPTPHVDQGWRDRFIAEQRLAERTGAQIGDALATVDAHCGESGESAEEAFGDPAAYSRSLVGDTGEPTRLAARTVAGIACGLLALLLVPRAVDAWIEGAAFTVTAGDLVAAVIVATLAAAVFWWPTPVLRWFVRHPATSSAAAFALLIVLIIPQALLRDPVLELGWVGPFVAGLVLLALSVVLPWRDLSEDDPVRDPRAGGTDSPTALGWFTAFLFPILALIMIGMDAVFRTMV
ncbi:hypothetical protein [Ornithinimicrobium cryptoxanthini]|uniref:Uncharacterized protein n=1 Tax=Ornithinimicrobium cryptoxanthini TaxID=2934161 RepID=A0ABY4YFQ8_9MICO|nr:hypothetical protein [Ornithinimicrobium cryptoxanthini]USQ75601.1 hypothetical protein NF557_13415 [Ornithinimicrobium cryptoxanthini]